MRMCKLGCGNRLKNERGQSLIIALMVMFVLVFIGIMFVLLVSRNQGRAGHSKEALEAQYLAEAGVNYADKMLRTSEEGADWRPRPDNSSVADDPDYQWLQPYDATTAPTGGYTRFTMGDGRYLLRVSYNPDPNEPNSKYIKIESIGRIGEILANDPTTFGDSPKLRRELVAYKPIGVTDYLRFVTNKEKRSSDIPLGAPGFNVTYGNEFTGAPMRVNGNLEWVGKNIDIYLRGKTYTSNGGTVTHPLPLDTIDVSGEILHNSSVSGVTLHEVIDGAIPTTDISVLPSSKTSFTTAGGYYRDGSDYTGANNDPRGIKRLEPPILDSNDTSNKVPRYVALTRDSGKWLNRTVSGTSTWVNSGQYGWGRGVYIDNKDDLQPESESLFGGYTPRSDWMKPNNDMKPYWQGPYYTPPGVIITLNPVDTDGDNLPDITITRTDVKTNNGNRKTVWYDANGIALGNATGGMTGSTVTIPYPQGNRVVKYMENGTTAQTITLNRNGVIYAEGNIRIRGMLPPKQGFDSSNPNGDNNLVDGAQLTVVSGGIIYVEGNLMKYRDKNGNVDDSGAIALLAKQHVCVNTTQFVSMMSSSGALSIGSDAGTGAAPYHVIITPDPSSTFFSSFSFGPSGATPNNPMLFVRHAGEYGPAYINMWLNRGLGAGTGLCQLDLSGTPVLGSSIYGCGDYRFTGNPGIGNESLFEHKIWTLDTQFLLNTGGLNTHFGMPNYFEVALDQSTSIRNNYLLSAFAIQPLDIRIEAIMYAQERSFFVIPGNWFNMNATDTPAAPTRPVGVDSKWPFYGQPLDTKITICGAITENLPASASEAGEWYAKWSGIPAKYGSSQVATAHPGDGLTFTYDPMLGWPTIGGVPVRKDSYGRTLPIAPKLPVCESLYYYGESM